MSGEVYQQQLRIVHSLQNRRDAGYWDTQELSEALTICQ
jgi:hypothetical protein